MNKKLLILLVAGTVIAMSLGLAVVWWSMGSEPAGGKSAAARHEQESRDTQAATTTVDLFGLVLPGRQTAEGDTAVVRTDLQLVIPFKYKIQLESQTSKVRDIIATILRSSDVAELNRDSLVGFKQQIVNEVRRKLGIEITEILVLRFKYDVVSLRVRH